MTAHHTPPTVRPQMPQREEQDVRSFFDNAVEGMFRKSRTGTFLLVNPALSKIFGYPSPGAMLRQFPEDRQAILLDAPRFLEMLEQLKSHGNISNFELQFRRRDGRLIWALINARAVYTTKGSIRYYEGTLVDITQRKETEFQRTFIEEQLRQSQKLEAVSILAGGMAADFGTLLQPILRNTEDALRNIPDNHAARRNLNEVLGAANRAKALMHQFLTISRQREGDKRPVTISPIITETLDDLRPLLPPEVDLREDLSAHPDTVLADPTQIRQVLENLMSNAIRAVGERGTISVSLRNVELDERTAAFRADLSPGHYIRLTVQDTGCGMTEQIATRIFDPFFTTESSSGAQGLGLSVAHGIARAHDGGITVLSEPELGSTFCLYLPSHAREVDQSQPLAPAPRLGSERILVVDADPRELRKWRGLLAPLGYRIDTISGSVEALRVFMESPPTFDLIVTAFAMPQMNGLELARTVKGIHPDVKVALCREATDPVTLDLARESGICCFARKPMDSQAMLHLLEVALDTNQE
ncbi:ATP-binding protein [Desulfovibrio mangrovi]|uniref:hybrid sensor histidine kinase/response regulator n=1 Tax=Desulfovibrio mangrovi TaxID=2976983 RepID=UPI002245E9C5|nr:ATP-binding protein [Desulfovibrio mangrovi]UZP67144.1 ATP-binding protein [Desulfovibrio mangrovi]